MIKNNLHETMLNILPPKKERTKILTPHTTNFSLNANVNAQVCLPWFLEKVKKVC